MAKVEDSQIHHHHVRIKIKGPSPPSSADNHSNNKNNVQRFFLCGFCKKAFTSVYALNGHTRIHSHYEKGNHVTAKSNNNNNVVNVKTCDGKPTCSNPFFPSSKSLFSHINTHSQTVMMRREITPCQNIRSGRRFNIAAASGDDDTFCHSSSAGEHSDDVYLSDGSVFRSWPLSCKRIRKPRLSGRRHRRLGNSCSEVEVDSLMLEAAETLMLLANGGDLCGDQAEFSEEQGNSTKRMKRMMMQG